MKKYFFIPICILVAACSTARKTVRTIDASINIEAAARISSLLETTDKPYAYYITPTGKKILLKKVDPELNERDTTTNNKFLTGIAITRFAAPGDEFKGSVRAVVKTSYSSSKNETYSTIPKLYNSLRSATYMNSLNIGHKDTRVKYEDRNVTIRTAYLYTITLEADNDFHLLIGNTPVYQQGITKVFNAEVSGVPRQGSSKNKEHIKRLRAKMIATFGGIPLCGRSHYLQEHTRITISGTLFYDTHHKSTPARCREVEGESAWEIHPVRDIRLL